MPYTMVDLIDKLILIEQNGWRLFSELSLKDGLQDRIRALARVFASEEKRHAEIFQNLKERVEALPNIEIDIETYDRASKLIFGFSRQKLEPGLEDTGQLLDFCLKFEKENLALVLNLQGLFVKNQGDMQTDNYKTLTRIIEEEQLHIDNIGIFLK